MGQSVLLGRGGVLELDRRRGPRRHGGVLSAVELWARTRLIPWRGNVTFIDKKDCAERVATLKV